MPNAVVWPFSESSNIRPNAKTTKLAAGEGPIQDDLTFKR